MFIRRRPVCACARVASPGWVSGTSCEGQNTSAFARCKVRVSHSVPLAEKRTRAVYTVRESASGRIAPVGLRPRGVNCYKLA